MKTHFDIEKIVDLGIISSELDYERALNADRKLRILSKEDIHFKKLRIKLRALIEKYENKEWNNVDQIDENKLNESKNAENIADFERKFIENRKELIKSQLKELELTQENLALILGHKSKTHMSELINGIKPFTLKDLIILNRILKIEMSLLVPVFLSNEDQLRIKIVANKLNKPKVKLLVADLF